MTKIISTIAIAFLATVSLYINAGRSGGHCVKGDCGLNCSDEA